jgi:hypothetical protein
MSDRQGPFGPADDPAHDHPGNNPVDDEAARRLRDVLSQEALAISPSADGLSMIREKIRSRRHERHGWVRAFQIGGAGLATAAIAVIAVIAVQHRSGSGKDNPNIAVAASTPAPVVPAASTPPATAAVASGSSAPSDYPVWVYYVDKRKDPQQLLFRESAQWPASPQHTFVKDAVNALLSTPAVDPDYTSYWPTGTTLISANIVNDTTAVIDLSSAAADGPTGEGTISAQQLLYTIIAAAPKIDGLQLQIAGQPVTSLWGSPIDPTLVALPAWQVWGHVWITQPLENATVASSVNIAGEASTFEGTVHWQILRDGGLLKQGSVQASEGAPDRGTWSVTVSGLAPGLYLLKAYEPSAKDGSVTYLDDKMFTVS